MMTFANYHLATPKTPILLAVTVKIPYELLCWSNFEFLILFYLSF